MGSVARIQNLLDAVSPQEPVTLAQLQAAIEGLAWKDDVRIAVGTNVNISSPGASLDSISMNTNDRVLLRGQTAQAENGIYIWNGAAVTMTRAVDMSTSAEFNQAVVPVNSGTDGGTQWRQTAVNPTVGTTAIVFSAFGTSAPSASESTAGIAEIATQAETDTGTDDARIVTPLKAKTASWLPKSYKANIGDGSATSITLTHNLNTRDVLVQVFVNSGNYEQVIVDNLRTGVNTVRLDFAVAPTINQYRVLIISVP